MRSLSGRLPGEKRPAGSVTRESREIPSAGEGGEERADLVVDLGRVVERPRHLLAEQLAIAAAEPLGRGAGGLLGKSQLGRRSAA